MADKNHTHRGHIVTALTNSCTFRKIWHAWQYAILTGCWGGYLFITQVVVSTEVSIGHQLPGGQGVSVSG